jgi:hypothetical protein
MNKGCSSALLWIDPKNPGQTKIVRVLVLLLPFAIYIASISLIFFSWGIPESPLGGTHNADYRNGFTILYGVSIVVILYSYYKICVEYIKK